MVVWIEAVGAVQAPLDGDGRLAFHLVSGPDVRKKETAAPTSPEPPEKRPRKQTAAPDVRKTAPKDWLENSSAFGWNPRNEDWRPADTNDARAARAIARQCHLVAKAVIAAKATSRVTDADLARELGKHENTVGRYLRGDAPMSLWVMNRMAAFLQLEVTLVVTPRD